VFELLPVVAVVADVAEVAVVALEELADGVAPLLVADWLSMSAMSCQGLEFRLLTLLIPDTTSTPIQGIVELLIALNRTKTRASSGCCLDRLMPVIPDMQPVLFANRGKPALGQPHAT
jgi:hypothetical protein